MQWERITGRRGRRDTLFWFRSVFLFFFGASGLRTGNVGVWIDALMDFTKFSLLNLGVLYMLNLLMDFYHISWFVNHKRILSYLVSGWHLALNVAMEALWA